MMKDFIANGLKVRIEGRTAIVSEPTLKDWFQNSILFVPRKPTKGRVRHNENIKYLEEKHKAVWKKL